MNFYGLSVLSRVGVSETGLVYGSVFSTFLSRDPDEANSLVLRLQESEVKSIVK